AHCSGVRWYALAGCFLPRPSSSHAVQRISLHKLQQSTSGCHAGLQERRGTKLLDRAFSAERIARFADSATVGNHQMRKNNPLFFRDNCYQVLLDFFGGLLLGEAKPVGESGNMSINYHARTQAEGVAKHNVCSLARYSR